MTLIHEYVWYVLGGAALLGFLVAWILRGLKKSPTEHRAVVDRDIALMELEQVRGELDSLFEAQRRRKTEGAAPAGQVADPRLTEEISRLQGELEKAGAQLKALKAEPPKEGAGTAEAQARKRQADDLRNALISRNEYLEERLHTVELRVHEMAKAQGALAAKPASPAPAGAGNAPLAPDTATEKLAWQADYLKLRVSTLQEKLLDMKSPDTGVTSQATIDPALEQDLARLRWRNRYLEGRLAYFDDVPERAETGEANRAYTRPHIVADAKAAQPETGRAAASRSAPRAPASRMAAPGPRFSSPMAARPESTSGKETGGTFSALATAAQDAEPAPREVAPSEARDSAARPERPPWLKAANGKPDDLTRISGLSSSLEKKLHGCGIWHFGQIANWSTAHEKWIDREFGLDGLVMREGWVLQARQLRPA